ncbi:Alanine--tRNA ligase [Nitrincola nitratireducens]|uniref:Alanine--tRNA ligase n=2 Tax=Nitrincola TaxID=267849 RepID=W9UYB1_9GAMM|nr:Alanine--tRNA ligase [Nitrincola nitratireducens]
MDVQGVKVLATLVEGADPKTLRDLLDKLRNKLESGVIVLFSAVDGKASVIAGVSKDLTNRIKAGDLVKTISADLGGKGGGRPDMAQGGGADIEAIPSIVQRVPALVEQAIS